MMTQTQIDQLASEFQSTLDAAKEYAAGEVGFSVWVHREPGKPWNFTKLAVPLGDPRFEPTGGFFGDFAEVRPIGMF